MKHHLCHVNPAAVAKLPQHTDDKSGIGLHYVDAYVRPLLPRLADVTQVKCKRRDLKVVLSVGTRTGEGLLRRLDVSADRVLMLDAPLQEAARGAGIGSLVEDGAILVDIAPEV